jgi:hypothetical protein
LQGLSAILKGYANCPNMNIVRARKPAKKPFILTSRLEEILRAIHFYRFMTSMDVARLLYSPKSITYVRDILSSLAGGTDFKNAQFLFRFKLPNTSTGSTTRIFTLGSKGREFLANEVGLPVDWCYRPAKTKHLSYSQVLHNLLLTRWLVAAQAWVAKQPNSGTEQIRVILHAKQHMPLNFNQLKNSLVFPMSIGTETECPS